MVARIKIGSSIRGILHYNEGKVIEGGAKLILASGFAADIQDLTFYNKLQRFQHLNELRPTVETNALHISLNFDASENISTAKMQEIAVAYMEQIGFGDQPFLVYRHNDAGHQHLHIATTSIQRNGNAISTHNIGRDLSEPARKAIEKKFNLVVAESKCAKQESGIKVADIEKAIYGRSATKKQISNVLAGVYNEYKFTSLSELNAVLKQFNVVAERGNIDSEMYVNKGLIYSLIGEDGKKVGVPIKSSSFYSKPTLRNLEAKFKKNLDKRKVYKQDLINRIDKVFSKYEQLTNKTLINELKQSGISLVLRQNDQGRIYGATFVDHHNKTVFNGSDLGKLYSANAIVERISPNDKLRTFLKPQIEQKSYLKSVKDNQKNNNLLQNPQTNLFKDLIGKSEPDYAPFIKRKKKKKKRGLTL